MLCEFLFDFLICICVLTYLSYCAKNFRKPPSSVMTFLCQSRLPQLSLSNQYITIYNREVLKLPSWLGQDFQTTDVGFPPFQVDPSAYVSITTVYRVSRLHVSSQESTSILLRRLHSTPWNTV